jgi:hypothetical protein
MAVLGESAHVTGRMTAMDNCSLDPAGSAEAARVARFRRWATPVILVVIALFAVGALAVRANAPSEEAVQFAELLGEPYVDLTVVFGFPAREESDGRGGWVMYYDDIQVVDGRFAKGSYRIFVGADGRVYKFERD